MKYDFIFLIVIVFTNLSLKYPERVTYIHNLNDIAVVDEISCNTENNINLLARLTFAESGILSDSAKLTTASVVINRVMSEDFPNSIGEVIYQKGQFDAIKHKNWVIKYDNLKYEELAYQVICNEFESNYLWYANPDISTDKKFIEWLFTGKGRYIDQHYYKE